MKILSAAAGLRNKIHAATLILVDDDGVGDEDRNITSVEFGEAIGDVDSKRNATSANLHLQEEWAR